MKQLLQKLSHMLNFPSRKSVENQSLDLAFAKTYSMAESPYHDAIIAMLKKIVFDAQTQTNEDDRKSIENALYCSVVKRMSKRQFNGDSTFYLSGLIEDVSSAKHEFSEVCYDNEHANDVFMHLKMGLTQHLIQLNNE